MTRASPRSAAKTILLICAFAGLAACAPITIQIGAPNATPTLTATATTAVTPSPTVQDTTATPSPSPSPSATPAPGITNFPPPAIITVIVPQPPPQQQATVATAPSKPSNFKAEGTGLAIAFTWNDNSLNETGFRIYQVGEVAPVINVPAHTATGGMNYSWTSRPCNLSASYYIRAYSDAGESASSDSDSAVTVPCVEASFIANGSGNSINFNWNDQDPNESGFRIYQEGVANPVGTRGPDVGSGGTNFTLNNLACNVDAKYFVRAYNSAGESPDSNHATGVTVPCGVSNLVQSGLAKTMVVFIFVDQSTNETGFHLYEDDNLVANMPARSGYGIQTGDNHSQPCAQTHVYSIKAYNAAGESKTSEHVGMTTAPCFP